MEPLQKNNVTLTQKVQKTNNYWQVFFLKTETMLIFLFTFIPLKYSWLLHSEQPIILKSNQHYRKR